MVCREVETRGPKSGFVFRGGQLVGLAGDGSRVSRMVRGGCVDVCGCYCCRMNGDGTTRSVARRIFLGFLGRVSECGRCNGLEGCLCMVTGGYVHSCLQGTGRMGLRAIVRKFSSKKVSEGLRRLGV